MSTSHRREVIDDHINNSNWKKLVNLGEHHLKGTVSKLTESIKSTPYLSTITGHFLGQRSVWQHLRA